MRAGQCKLTSTPYLANRGSNEVRWLRATNWSPSDSPAVAGAMVLFRLGSGRPVKSVVSA